MSEARKNLLVRNKAYHYPFYVYDDGWLDGRGVESDGRAWSDSGACDFSCELTAGTYTFTVETDGPDTYLQESVRITAPSGATYDSKFPAGAGLGQPVTFTVTDKTAGTWFLVGKRRGARWRAALFAGDTPAAWAPAEGETLPGGGAQISANLWDSSTASMQVRADGTYLSGANNVVAELNCKVTGLAPLTENQTIHMGASLKNANAGALKPFVEYKDAAGNLNWVGFPSWQPTGSWQRFDGTCVVPSGMTVTKIGFNNSAATGDIEVSNPVFSYGSPVVLARAAHGAFTSLEDGNAAAAAANDAKAAAETALDETRDLVTLRIDSSRGTVFKNSEVSTVLQVRCWKKGAEITSRAALRDAMGNQTARIRWWVLRMDDTDWVSLDDGDSKLSDDGFRLTLTPDDIDVKCTFKAEVVTD